MNRKRLDAIEQRVGAHCPFHGGYWNFAIVIGVLGSSHKVTDRQGNTVPITPEVEEQIEQHLKSKRIIDIVVVIGEPEPNIDDGIEPRGVS